MADPSGHAAAAIAGMELFEISSRRSGRTSRLLELVQDGDRVICHDERHARLVKQQLRDRGKVAVDVGHAPPCRDGLLRRFGTMPKGRTFVDHEWARQFFAAAIDEARGDLTKLLTAMSKTWPDAPEQEEAAHLRDWTRTNSKWGR
jgi:hypothetical protein